MSKTHRLKTWPHFFQEIVDGKKTFELRANDRDFQPFDLLILDEFEPNTRTYTGRTMTRRAGFVMYGPNFGIEAGWCIISLLPEEA